MSIDINAEIAARKQLVIDQLNEANPNGVNEMTEVFEDEISSLVDTMFDNFDEMFLDVAIALNTYEGLTEADEDTVFEWQSDMMNAMLRRYARKIAVREIEHTGPEGLE